MKKLPTGIAALLIALLFVGCAQSRPEAQNQPAAPSQSSSATPLPSGPALTSEQQNGKELAADFGTNASTRVFDYAELTNYFYHCDPCTVTDTVAKIGETPTSLTGHWNDAGNQWVELVFPSVTVTASGTAELSFAGTGLSTEPHQLTNADQTLPLSILTTGTTDTATALPRGLMIGTSTREQVQAAYPADSALYDFNDDEGNSIYFAHSWFADGAKVSETSPEMIGGVYYEFDDQDVLTRAEAIWSVTGE